MRQVRKARLGAAALWRLPNCETTTAVIAHSPLFSPVTWNPFRRRCGVVVIVAAAAGVAVVSAFVVGSFRYSRESALGRADPLVNPSRPGSMRPGCLSRASQ